MDIWVDLYTYCMGCWGTIWVYPLLYLAYLMSVRKAETFNVNKEKTFIIIKYGEV